MKAVGKLCKSSHIFNVHWKIIKIKLENYFFIKINMYICVYIYIYVCITDSFAKV